MCRRILLAFTLLMAGAGAAPAEPGSSEGIASRLLEDAKTFGVGQQIPDFRFTDVQGRRARLSAYDEAPAIVIAMRDLGCPLSRRYAPRLAQIESEYAARGVVFLYLNASEHDAPDAIAADAAEQRLGGRHVHEPAGHIARLLGARHTTDVFVIDGAGILRYRGAVDDQHGIGFTRRKPGNRYLMDALDAVLRGDQPKVEATIAAGCLLPLEPKPTTDPPTYHGRVSRIIQSHCAPCHREDGVGPFSLTEYRQVRGRRSMIRYVLEEGIMPPWHAAPGTGPWTNDISLSEADRQVIFDWIEAECPEGDPSEAPPPRQWPEAAAWAIGEPDAVLQIPEAFEIPAQGVLDYHYTWVKTDFDRDVWIRGIEIKPTAPQVVHHVLVFIEDPPAPGEDRRQVRRRWQGGLQGYFAGLVPGAPVTQFPHGMAKKLPKGAWLKFQIHYTANGTAVKDQTQIGFVFADEPPADGEIHTGAVAAVEFRIPPGDPNYQVRATKLLPAGTVLYGFSPHMHLRGKAFRYELLYPDGRRQLLLDVPHYDFDWQTMYRLKTPLRTDSLAQLICTAWFDNSSDNPANPNPAASVRFGAQTWDEMMIGYYEWSRAPGAEAN